MPLRALKLGMSLFFEASSLFRLLRQNFEKQPTIKFESTKIFRHRRRIASHWSCACGRVRACVYAQVYVQVCEREWVCVQE